MHSTIHDQSTTVLNTTTVDTLNRLVRLNIDSCKGWMTAAEHTDDAHLRTRFLQFARIRDQAGNELQQLVRAGGIVPPENGTVEGSVHRWWVELRAKITGASLHTLLVDAERGEDAIKAEYEKAIAEPTSAVLTEVLTRQFAQVQTIHDEVRSLRDISASAA